MARQGPQSVPRGNAFAGVIPVNLQALVRHRHSELTEATWCNSRIANGLTDGGKKYARAERWRQGNWAERALAVELKR